MVQKCLETDGLGYQVFNVSNDDHSVHWTSEELIETYYQGVPINGDGFPEFLYECKSQAAIGVSTCTFMA